MTVWFIQILDLEKKISNYYSKHFSINNSAQHSTFSSSHLTLQTFIFLREIWFSYNDKWFCVGYKNMWQRSSYCKLESTYYRQTKFVINFTRLNLAFFPCKCDNKVHIYFYTFISHFVRIQCTTQLVIIASS